MVETKIRFTAERAPCGKFRNGVRHRALDDFGLIINDVTFDSRCRLMHHECHDGITRIRTIRPDGRVLSADCSSTHDGR